MEALNSADLVGVNNLNSVSKIIEQYEVQQVWVSLETETKPIKYIPIQNMISKHLILLFVLMVSTTLCGQTYITNVTVVDVENQKLVPDQTIEITGNLISDIQKSKKVKIPEGAKTIDGSGKYLAPGLVDAHIHFFQNGGLYARPDAIDLQKYMPYDKEIALSKADMEAKLRRYIQNGITTVIDVGATYNYLKQREDYADKDYAPGIFMTGPLLTTYEPTVYQNLDKDEPFTLTKTIEEGIVGVKDQLKYNPDFIKIWYIAGADGLSVEKSARKNLPIVKAIIDEAHKNNLKVAVHATQRITAQLAVENGADFLVHSVDDEILNADFVALLKKNQTVLCPTLTVSAGYLKTFGQNLDFNTHQLQKADPYQLGTLLDLKHIADTSFVQRYKSYGNNPAAISRLKKADEIGMANLKILSDAGVTIATGTDAGNIGTMHASSYLAELKAMSSSGMSNWQILEASTVNGAKILDRENEMGTITVGKKANLLLLDANPVEDLANLTRINTVINKGVVFNPGELLKDSPEDLAQKQLIAYNFRDIDAFLEPYADDVEIYTYPDQLQMKGKDAMRAAYSRLFKNTPNLYCELVNRIVQGNTVFDKERVRFGDRISEVVAMYRVENGKIKQVYFIR